jgi:pantetheine-phosphate adenylyltransferase
MCVLSPSLLSAFRRELGGERYLRFGADPRGTRRLYARVATGGTFDHIHAGHRRLLERSFEVGDEVVIGLTSDEFLAKVGKTPEYTYERREAELRRYLEQRFPGRRYLVAKLYDYFGPGIVDGGVEALVASPETAPRVKLANELRAERGFSPLALVTVDWVNAEDGKPISSTRIRRGELDSEGRLSERPPAGPDDRP